MTNQSNFFSAKRSVMAACLLVGITSCDGFKAADPLITHYAEVKNPNRDTMIVISNGKLATRATVSFEETLSDTALVKISPDTLFSQHGATFLLPITNPPMMSIGGLVGDSLFIKYQPYNKPISGNVKIAITFQ